MESTWGRLLRRFTVSFAAYGRTTRYTKKISTRNNPWWANWASYWSRRGNSRVSTTKAKQSLFSPISMVWGNDAWSPWNRGSQHGHRLPRKTEFSEPEVFTRNPASIQSKGLESEQAQNKVMRDQPNRVRVTVRHWPRETWERFCHKPYGPAGVVAPGYPAQPIYSGRAFHPKSERPLRWRLERSRSRRLWRPLAGRHNQIGFESLFAPLPLRPPSKHSLRQLAFPRQ